MLSEISLKSVTPTLPPKLLNAIYNVIKFLNTSKAEDPNYIFIEFCPSSMTKYKVKLGNC